MSSHGERPGATVSGQWADWRARVDLDEYDRRWDQMANRGDHAHGEADLIESITTAGASILDAGCGMGRVAIELAARGFDVVGVDLDDDLLGFARRRAPHMTWAHDDLATMDLGRRFDVVAMPGNVMLYCRVDVRPAVVRTLAAHLEADGVLVAGFSLAGRLGLPLDEYDRLCAGCDLELVHRFATWERQPYDGGDYAVSIHRAVSARPL